MNIQIRKTNFEDFRATENLTREVFWDLYKPGCEEHLVLKQLRDSASYISELDLIAVNDGEIIGHIISTKAKIVNSEKTSENVLCVGPLSVLQEYQSKGIGSKLLNASIELSKELGFDCLVLFGNPDYYKRFGFVNAEVYGITTKDGFNFEQFMALVLNQDISTIPQGYFIEDSAFQITKADLENFELSFPEKEKHVLPTQIFNE